MSWDAVIGCASVDASPSFLRLHTSDGAHRTIPWSAINIAGLGGNHGEQYTMEGVTEITRPYFPTHDSLWVVYADGGFAQIMIQHADPKRDSILATFAQQLGPKWRADQLTLNEILDVKSRSAAKRPFPKLMIVMLAIMVLSFLIPLVVILVLKHRTP